jgi:hypothetical protein
MLGYDDNGDRIIRTRKLIHFLMCGQNVSAQTDVCVMEDDEFQYLLVQEDKVCRPTALLASFG